MTDAVDCFHDFIVTARKVTSKVFNEWYNFMYVNGDQKIHLEVKIKVKVFYLYENVDKIKNVRKAFYDISSQCFSDDEAITARLRWEILHIRHKILNAFIRLLNLFT